LLEKHGLEDSLREILAAIEIRQWDPARWLDGVEVEPVDEVLARIAGKVAGRAASRPRAHLHRNMHANPSALVETRRNSPETATSWFR
jgi:hypothetical protein